MNVIILEDEYGAANNLKAILTEVDDSIAVIAVIESVEGAVKWLQTNPAPDLGFLDIQLADGLSFELFEQVDITFPVVFTTAFDQYAIKAFKVNSIDYVLKPVNTENIGFAINKYHSLNNINNPLENVNLSQIIRQLKFDISNAYKRSLLIHFKDKLIPLETASIAITFIDSGIVYILTHDGQKYSTEQSLDELERILHPDNFFRINRQIILSRKAIKEISVYFSGRFKIGTEPTAPIEVTVSKGRMAEFRKWLLQ